MIISGICSSIWECGFKGERGIILIVEVLSLVIGELGVKRVRGLMESYF